MVALMEKWVQVSMKLIGVNCGISKGMQHPQLHQTATTQACKYA